MRRKNTLNRLSSFEENFRFKSHYIIISLKNELNFQQKLVIRYLKEEKIDLL